MKNFDIRKVLAVILFFVSFSFPQEVLTTGGKKMPNEWIDKDTHHEIIRITRREGNSRSFYFHNYPFIPDKNGNGYRMVFYGSDSAGTQIYTVNLSTLKIDKLTYDRSRKFGEIVGRKSHDIYFQERDSVFAVNADSHKRRPVFVFPEDFTGAVTCLNADETLLGGAWAPRPKFNNRSGTFKRPNFDQMYEIESKIPHTLFVINLKTHKLKKIYTYTAWLNHVQFSPTDPSLMMFCHEGIWQKVNRIWTININTGKARLMYKRTMPMEIAGHEWFGPDGQTIWFDLQQPRGKTFFVAGVNVRTDKLIKYRLTRNEWSVHYTISPDEKIFAGDGGDTSSVARAKDGKWIYLFTPEGDHFKAERLVNMKHDNYRLEPNVHFSPDGKWIIFRANFEGFESVYAVKIKKV